MEPLTVFTCLTSPTAVEDTPEDVERRQEERLAALVRLSFRFDRVC